VKIIQSVGLTTGHGRHDEQVARLVSDIGLINVELQSGNLNDVTTDVDPVTYQGHFTRDRAQLSARFGFVVELPSWRPQLQIHRSAPDTHFQLWISSKYC
jgi:hypothetical protein